MRRTLILFALTLGAMPAFGQADAQREQCYGSKASADQVIAACTALIAADQGKASDLAKDYANRAYGQRARGLGDLAIADAARAILLRPDYEFAYNIRGIVNADKGLNERALADFSDIDSLADRLLATERAKVIGGEGGRAGVPIAVTHAFFVLFFFGDTSNVVNCEAIHWSHKFPFIIWFQ